MKVARGRKLLTMTSAPTEALVAKGNVVSGDASRLVQANIPYVGPELA